MMKNLLLFSIIITLIAGCNTKDVKEYNDNQSEIIDSVNNNSSIESEVALNKAPNFSLPDIDGNLKTLEDYKGKLIYLDIWATWCGPCRMQIPAMKELEKKYKDQDIVFLSISVDPEKDKNKWKQMIKDEQMSGEHLYAGVTSSSFGYDYKVEFIPRFVLISPNGDILMDHAPQPIDMNSGGINPDLIRLFDLYIQPN